ncbi:hypothetical protein EOPP23_17410 [Endozoicomonas sp. OPT23]|nr:hypothetical protein [Endozoicomonas sp. OPT23]
MDPFSARESYGTNPVAKQDQQAGAKDSLLIMVNYLINPGTILTSAMAVADGLSVYEVILVQGSGVMLSMVLFLLLGRIGVDYGITGQMACRVSLGYRGGRYLTSPLRVICSIYWFAFQTVAGGLAIQAVLDWFGFSVDLIPVSLLFACLQVLVAVLGYSWLRNVFAWAFPIKIFCIVYLLCSLMQTSGWRLPEPEFQFDAHWLLLISWFNGVFVSMLTMMTDAADFTRYQYSLKRLWSGALAGSALGVGVGAFTGAYAIYITGGSVNELFQNILSMLASPIAAAALLLLIVFDNWTINIINLYSGGLSFNHVMEQWSRARCTLLISLAAILLSCFPAVVNNYLDNVTRLAWLFPAITGVMLADLVSRCWQVDVEELYEPNGVYSYNKGFRARALIIIFVSGISYSLMPADWPTPLIMVFGSFLLMILSNHI